MWRNMFNNLSTNQKILICVILQIIVIIILVAVVNVSLNGEKKHMLKTANENDNYELQDIPSEMMNAFEKQLWLVVSDGYNGLADDKVNYTIRDGSYNLTAEDDTYGATFLVDVDVLRQTYLVTLAWTNNRESVLSSEVIINCPPIDQMKYPETVCKSMYTTTASPELYLPHYITSDEAEGGLIEAYITNDLGTNTINVDMSPCKLEETRKKVDDYLNSTGIILDEYQINYYISSSDVDCEYKTTLMEEYYDGEE